MKRASPRRGSGHRQRDKRGDAEIREPLKTYYSSLRRRPESSKINIFDSSLRKKAVRHPDKPPPPPPPPPKGAAKSRRHLMAKKPSSIFVRKAGHAIEFTEILVDDGEVMIYSKSKTR